MPKNDLPIRHPDAPLEPTHEEITTVWQHYWRSPDYDPAEDLQFQRVRNQPEYSNPHKDGTNGSGSEYPPLYNRGDTGTGTSTPKVEAELVVKGEAILRAGDWPEELMEEPEKVTSLIGRPGELELFAGRPFAGKSTFLGQVAAEAANDGLQVMWLSFEEGPNRILSRLKLHEGGDRVFVPTFDQRPRSRLDMTALLKAAREKIDLVIIDSGASYCSYVEHKIPDPQQGEKWQDIYGFLKEQVTGTRTALIVNVHMGHKGSNVRGSSGIEAAADAVYRFTHRKGGSKTDRVIEEEGRWGAESFDLVYRDEVYSISNRELQIFDVVSEHLMTNPDDINLTQGELARKLKIRKADIGRALKQIETGEVPGK